MTISLTPVPAGRPSPNSTSHKIADPSALWPQDPITSAAPYRNRPCCPCYRHHPLLPPLPTHLHHHPPMHHFRCKVSAAKSNISTLELFHPISSIGRRRGGVWRGREGEGRWLQKTMALGTPMGKSDQPTVCTGRDRVVGSGEAADRRVASVLGGGELRILSTTSPIQKIQTEVKAAPSLPSQSPHSSASPSYLSLLEKQSVSIVQVPAEPLAKREAGQPSDQTQRLVKRQNQLKSLHE